MNIRIFVAAHKTYKMPTDTIYQPIFVGTLLHNQVPEGYISDGTGQNISKLNPNFNELTAIYWAWKNDQSDVKGLVHYRRYLSKHPSKDFSTILSRADIEKILQHDDIILPSKRHYVIESNAQHYKNAHMFNMFIMRSSYFDEYCEWLFDVLFKLKDSIDITDYDAREARVFGYLSELMLDMWIEKNSYSYREVPVQYLEAKKTFQKGLNLIARKLFPNREKKTHF